MADTMRRKPARALQSETDLARKSIQDLTEESCRMTARLSAIMMEIKQLSMVLGFEYGATLRGSRRVNDHRGDDTLHEEILILSRKNDALINEYFELEEFRNRLQSELSRRADQVV